MTNVFKPKSEAEISDAVRKLASTKTPLEIIGGGTKLGLGNQVDTEHRVHTGGVTGIQLYEPGALTVVAKSGTPLTTLEKLLADEGQHLPFEPPDYRNLLGSNGEPTIGGIVACGISGPRRIQTGACRDALIGVRFISSSGDIIKNGGRVLFGSNFPMLTPGRCLKRLDDLGLDDEARGLFLSGAARRVFKL